MCDGVVYCELEDNICHHSRGGHIVLLLRSFSCVSPACFMSVMRYGNTVAGGILLATGLLHAVPEAIALYEQSDKPVGAYPPGVSASAPTSGAHAGHNHGAHGHSIQFSAVFSIILASFYAVLIVEHLLISVCQRNAVNEEENLPYDPDRSESLDLALYGQTSMTITPNFATDRRQRAEDGSEQGGIGHISRAFMTCLRPDWLLNRPQKRHGLHLFEYGGRVVLLFRESTFVDAGVLPDKPFLAAHGRAAPRYSLTDQLLRVAVLITKL